MTNITELISKLQKLGYNYAGANWLIALHKMRGTLALLESATNAQLKERKKYAA